MTVVTSNRDAALKKAEKLLRQGRLDAAIAEYVRLVEEQPRDLTTANTLGDLYLRAGQRESAVAQFLGIATHLEREGFLPKAAALYKKILKITPDDEQILLRSAEIAMRQGLLADAKATLTLLIKKCEARGDQQGAAAVWLRLAEIDPQNQAVLQGFLARGDLDAAFAWVERRADRAIEAGEWLAAFEAVQPLVTQVPHHVPALMKLVEICVDGGLDERVSDTQAQLADAYLQAGAGREARLTAEDLLAREPENPAHRERLRQALVLLGEPDPDRVIEEALPVAADFDAPDLNLEPAIDAVEMPAVDPSLNAAMDAARLESVAAPEREPRTELEWAPEPEPVPRPEGERPPDGYPLDLAGGIDAEPIEWDLSDELARLEPVPSIAGDAADAREHELDALFAKLRSQATREQAIDGAERAYHMAMEREAAGDEDEASRFYAQATRSPRRRFEASARLARLLFRRHAWEEAVDWFERAAQATAPTIEESRALLYDLGCALEASEEGARALAVYLELQADAGRYRDVADRIERLSAPGQIRG